MEHTPKYLENVFKQLTGLIPGQAIDIHLADTDLKREKYTDAAMLFINNGNHDYEFSNNYRYLIRLELPNEWKQEMDKS